MNNQFESLSEPKTCQHFCSGAYYHELPCTKEARVTMNGKALCTLHIGIEVYRQLNIYKFEKYFK